VKVKIMLDLYRVIQPVKNIEEAARFYSHVLGIPGERVSPGRHYFICGHTILACYDPITDGSRAPECTALHRTASPGH
jgi:catechol 2,3-dioxygenase-like lactoylglutathione lyase family enzyme